MAWDRGHWSLDLARAVIGSSISVGFAYVIACFVPLYELAADERDTNRLPVAYLVAWAGIVMSLAYTVILLSQALWTRRSIGWTPLVAVPLLIGSWVAGFLVAIVVSG
jgi:hypothetical protein